MDNCEYCLYYDYDEEYDCYTCSMPLDEDELRLFMEKRHSQCPYYRPGNEYSIVRKQN